jgi:hypothetical protein
MYNGSPGTGGSYNRGGRFALKPIYLYIAGAIAVLIAIFFVFRFLNTSLVVHFGAYAGLLLLIANVRELIGNSYGQKGSTAMLNVLVGGGLIFAWLTQFLGALLWLPAILLLVIATPLIFGRARVYTAYLDTARTIAGGVKRTLVR